MITSQRAARGRYRAYRRRTGLGPGGLRLWMAAAGAEGLGTAERVDWFNKRLHSGIGDAPPHEYETTHYAQLQPRPTVGVNA
jgi:hypothetical protein